MAVVGGTMTGCVQQMVASYGVGLQLTLLMSKLN